MFKTIFIAIGIFLLLSSGPAAHAKTIGVIMSADIPYYQEIHKAFVDAYGKGDEIVLQKPAPDPMSWSNAARKLTGIGSSVIVTYGAPALLTTMKETSDIPIVFAGVYDPDSMSISGKNATGVCSTVSVDSLLKSLSGAKKIGKLGVIFSKSEKDTIIQVRDVKKNEGALGFVQVLFSVTDKVSKDELKGVDALFLTTCGGAMMNISDVVEAARRDKIPTAAIIGGGENAGIIFSLVPDSKEQGAGVAEIVKKIIGGSKPADIPLKQAKDVKLIINNKEAKTLGITIPQSILSAGSKVIE